MKSVFNRAGRGLGYLLIAALILVAAIGGILVGVYWRQPGSLKSITGSFTAADRLRYRAALEKLRYDLRAAKGSPPFEQTMGEEQLRAAMAEDEKKERLLREKCDLQITDAMIEEEYEQLKADPGDTRVLAGIVEALDRDPAALIEFWLRPTLVDRYLRACVAVDDHLNAPARTRIEELRRQGGTAPAAMAFNRKSPAVEPEDREALAAAAAGEPTAVVESPIDFHYFIVRSIKGDTVTAGLVSIPKPDFEEWLKSQQ